MNCDTAQDSMLLDMAGELDAHRQKALEKHLSECSVCTKALEEAGRTQGLVDKAMAASMYAPDNLVLRVMQAVRRLPNRGSAWSFLPNAFPRKWRVAPIFAALALLFVGYLLGFLHARHMLPRRVHTGKEGQNVNWNYEKVARIRRSKDRNAQPTTFPRTRPRKA